MNEQDMQEIYETMLHQEKLLLELKIQIESLKSMMFEHRPAFTEAFAQQVTKITQTPGIQQLQSQIAQLEAGLNRQR
jgi:X-X-X-Leu-X-X-Gly heptad repeat protein